MAKRTSQYHVVPSPSGGWAVKRAATSRASRVFHVKTEAVSYARDAITKKGGGELVIHRQDGTIKDMTKLGETAGRAREAS